MKHSTVTSILIGCTLTFFLIGVSQLQADLLLNGSFEESSGAPTDWNPTGNLSVISSQGETDGVNALAFSFGNLSSNGVISQSFATAPGTTYMLNFDFGKYSINQPLQFARLDVDVFSGIGFGGMQLLDQTVADGTPGSGDADSTDSAALYSMFEFSFLADGNNSTLRFSDVSDAQVSGGGFDAMLDNVRVSAVPEPNCGFAIAACFCAILSSKRTRRRF